MVSVFLKGEMTDRMTVVLLTKPFSRLRRPCSTPEMSGIVVGWGVSQSRQKLRAQLATSLIVLTIEHEAKKKTLIVVPKSLIP